MELEELKEEVSQFIASLPDDRPFSASELFSDFKKAKGRSILFTKYGFTSFEAFLLQLPSIVLVESSKGRLLRYVRPLTPDSSVLAAGSSNPTAVTQFPSMRTPFSPITSETITDQLISLLEISGGEATIDALKNMYRMRFDSDFVDDMRSWFNVGSFAEYGDFFRGKLTMYQLTMDDCRFKWMFRLNEWPNVGFRLRKPAGCQETEEANPRLHRSMSPSGSSVNSVAEFEEGDGFKDEEARSIGSSFLPHDCQNTENIDQQLEHSPERKEPATGIIQPAPNDDKLGPSSCIQQTSMKTEHSVVSEVRKPREPIVFVSRATPDSSLIEVDSVSSPEYEADPPQMGGRRVILKDMQKDVPKPAKHKKLHADMCVRNVISLLEEMGGRASLPQLNSAFQRIYGTHVASALKNALGVKNLNEVQQVLKGVIDIEKAAKDYLFVLAKPKRRGSLAGRVSAPPRRQPAPIIVATAREHRYRQPQYSFDNAYDDMAMDEFLQERVCIDRVYF